MLCDVWERPDGRKPPHAPDEVWQPAQWVGGPISCHGLWCWVRAGAGSKQSDSHQRINSTFANTLLLNLQTYFSGTTYSRTGFRVALSRRLMPILLNVYVPSSLLVITSWIGFLIPLSQIPGRQVVTQFKILRFLSLLMQNGSAGDEPPNVDQPGWVGHPRRAGAQRPVQRPGFLHAWYVPHLVNCIM